MSLPPTFLEDLRTHLSIAQVVGRKVVWDNKKTNAGKGDYWAPCPFHQEKTASFHVDDKKGFYYCFGCHAKGDALNFIRETENVGFMDAVEIMAREAGMTMPARDPKAQEKADRNAQLAQVMESAVQFYRLQLKTSVASDARSYLQQRGLSGDTQTQFEIGFAADVRQGLYQHLREKGVSDDLIITAGLAVKPDDGGAPFDRFRGRIIFPIRDPRGRAIAFGGRAMDPNARAKYLNSPETPLFDKGRCLYNFAAARTASGHSGQLVIAEGYMDVIALAQAGIAHAVAPLGTAITETQLQLMWRICPEPTLALDGDTAGQRAAVRAVDLALPLLEPGKSLRFALLPGGLDPDDLIKSQGVAAMRDLLERAHPMIELLWQREVDGKVLDSPERRAALDASLKSALAKINDSAVRNHYTAAIRQLRNDLFKPPARPWRGAGRNNQAPAKATESAKTSLLAQAGGADGQEHMRETVILALCLTYPDILHRFETALEKLPFRTPGYAGLRDILLAEGQEDGHLSLADKIDAELGAGTVEKLLSHRHVKIAPALRANIDNETAAFALAEELAKHEANRGAIQELSDAMHDIEGLVDEGLTWRLLSAAQARHAASRAQLADGKDDDETKILSEGLQNLIDNQIWVKKKQ